MSVLVIAKATKKPNSKRAREDEEGVKTKKQVQEELEYHQRQLSKVDKDQLDDDTECAATQATELQQQQEHRREQEVEASMQADTTALIDDIQSKLDTVTPAASDSLANVELSQLKRTPQPQESSSSSSSSSSSPAPAAVIAVAGGSAVQEPPTKKRKSRAQEEIDEINQRAISPAEKTLRLMTLHSSGYRLHHNDLKTKNMVLKSSVMSSAKVAKFKEKAGRDLKNMKTRYVNLNNTFPSMPASDTIFTKWVPDLAKKLSGEQHSVLQLAPPSKMRWVRLTGLGTFDKESYPAAHEEEAQHEFSLTAGAFNENLVNDMGLDPSSSACMEALNSLWGWMSAGIEADPEIAPELHKQCKDEVDKQAQAEAASAASFAATSAGVLASSAAVAAGASAAMATQAAKDAAAAAMGPGGSGSIAAASVMNTFNHKERNRAHYMSNFIKNRDGCMEQKFSARMFAYPTAEEREAFKKNPYVAPSDRMQKLYDENPPAKKVIYHDFPVVRPKTKEEVDATWETDENPFAFVPYNERDQIKDGSLGSCLFEVAVTENHQGKSYFKTKPLLLIWLPSVAKAATRDQRTKPKQYPFEPVETTEGYDDDSSSSSSSSSSFRPGASLSVDEHGNIKCEP